MSHGHDSVLINDLDKRVARLRERFLPHINSIIEMSLFVFVEEENSKVKDEKFTCCRSWGQLIIIIWLLNGDIIINHVYA